MSASRHTGPTTASRLLIALMMATAVVGLLLPGVYREPASGEEFSKAYWLAEGLVTLFVVGPVALLALRAATRGSPRARLVWLGTVYYVLYGYAFMVFGATLNWFFPLYVALVMLASWLLLQAVASPPGWVDGPWQKRDHAPRWISVFLTVVAAIVTWTWVSLWLHEARKGTGGSVTGQFVRSVAGIDIPLLAGATAVAAWATWRGVRWAVAATAVVSVGCGLYMLVLACSSVLNARAEGDGPSSGTLIWAVLAALSLMAAWHATRDAGSPIDGPGPAAERGTARAGTGVGLPRS